MNETKIEWCDMTWNPVTGCFNDCPYCYARNTAKRFGGHSLGSATLHSPAQDEECELDEQKMIVRQHTTQKAPYPFDFLPTLHRYRLAEPEAKKPPRTIFVCSMADLFGEGIRVSWQAEVLDACQRAPWHRYLFLTKNPVRYAELDQVALLPHGANFWYGATLTKGSMAEGWGLGRPFHKFLSVEPLHGEVSISNRDNSPPEWVIIGAETGNRKDKVVPERAWVEAIVAECRLCNIPVFMKDSLKPIWGEELLTETPWGGGES